MGNDPCPLTVQVNLAEWQIRQLCLVTREIFLEQPMLLELEAPVNIVGDIHGQYEDLLRHFDKLGYPPDANYLFLGDYVDRVYGFYDECKRRYSVKLWKTFTDLFNCLPVAALIEGTIFCMHGGLSPQLGELNDIRSIPRPIDVPDSGLVCDLLWGDPAEELTNTCMKGEWKIHLEINTHLNPLFLESNLYLSIDCRRSTILGVKISNPTRAPNLPRTTPVNTIFKKIFEFLMFDLNSFRDEKEPRLRTSYCKAKSKSARKVPSRHYIYKKTQRTWKEREDQGWGTH
uniref:protein-serine/threonine phosphatase n=1 Tax=Timema douglasi TaxID=61478 RepID=A0A7R8VAE3_TIMDO|nr:unnamed protein product [Timema douglasi]